jgi:ribosome assembly protein YihI (activator of Der GTPase)
MKTTYFEMLSRLHAIKENLYLTESLVDEQWISSKIGNIETLMEKLGHDIEEVEPVEMIDELF